MSLYSREHLEELPALLGGRLPRRQVLTATMLDAGEYLYAGGGGPSSCINPTCTSVIPASLVAEDTPKPSWQSGTGVPSDGVRDIPDLSLFAGNG